MTHREQRLWLIQQLLNERNDAAGVQIPEDEQGQKDLLRGLMNIRMPDPIDDEFLRIQDEYLTEENLAEGVVKIEDLTPVKADNRLYIWQGDMSRLAVDAVTLPANSGFTGCYQYLHNCLDNILGSKAGIELRLFTNSIITKQGYPEPQIYYPYGRSYRSGSADQRKRTAAGFLLQIYPGTGGSERYQDSRIVLYFHRCIHVSESAGGRDCCRNCSEISGGNWQPD